MDRIALVAAYTLIRVRTVVVMQVSRVRKRIQPLGMVPCATRAASRTAATLYRHCPSPLLRQRIPEIRQPQRRPTLNRGLVCQVPAVWRQDVERDEGRVITCH